MNAMEKDIQKNGLASLNIPSLTGDRYSAEASYSPSPVSALDRWMARKLLDLLGLPPLAFVLWNGEQISPSGVVPAVRVLMHDSEVLHQLLINPALHFGDLYTAGRIDIEGDLVDFLEIAYRAAESSPKYQKLKHAQTRLFYRPRKNQPDDSRDTIHHHYDIGRSEEHTS